MNKYKPLARTTGIKYKPLARMWCEHAGMIKNNRNKYKALERMWREHCQPLAAMRVIGKEHNLLTVAGRKLSFSFSSS